MPSSAYGRLSRCPRAEVFRRLLDFLNRLDTAHIHYTLGHTGPESVMVDIEMERYKSVAGVKDDPALLEELLAEADLS